MYEHKKFPRIGGLHNVIKSVDHWAELSQTPHVTLDYRAKVKLHGTNMGVRIYPDGKVIAQSRNEDLASGGYQFPEFVAAHNDYFRDLIGDLDAIIVYGEWAGPGVQQKVSVSQIPDKAFFVFACRLFAKETDHLVTDPAELEALLIPDGRTLPERFHIIPWHDEEMRIAFGDKDGLECQAAEINASVERIDACDPLVQSLYGAEGHGEGLVFYPLGKTDRDEFSRYAFKVKGKSHEKAKGGDKKARVAVPIAENVHAFVEMMVTPARIEQGIGELFGDGPFAKGRVGNLIKWVAQDVRTEGADELEASDLDWSQVAKLLSGRVREHYFALSDNG